MPVISPFPLKREAAAEGGIAPNLAHTGNDYRDPGPGDARVIAYECSVTYQGAWHVCDGIELPSVHATYSKAEVS